MEPIASKVPQLSNYPPLDYYELYDVLLLLLHKLINSHSEHEGKII